MVYSKTLVEPSRTFVQKKLLLATKPTFILKKMEEYKLPVLFMDTDFVFLKFPSIFFSQESTDIDFMSCNWNEVQQPKKELTPSLHSSSGVLFFNNTEPTKRFLRQWKISLLWKGNRFAAGENTTLKK